MNYERMWKSLKKIIDEEEDILSREMKKASTGILYEELSSQREEADYIAGKIEKLEERELSLQNEREERGKNE